ncbi:phage baseplate assembly protein W [Azospirillum fermentarium]|uniref:GPW/gp25 family protein n=1 Tax=Azospirillum fermentarium TaxID=1233114 RepID=UPI002225FE59|nr:GPW/gp25 family protein [Azospirillum fermentarium]MCW2247934.1 phage baseplate assembly protein W [Azospirillum fermentarium]
MTYTDDAPFLGTGWSFPPTFDRTAASVTMSKGVQDIKESLWILLSTRLGERLMLPAYGASLWDKVFTTLTTTAANQIRSLVAKAILDWEPRIDVEEVSVETIDYRAGQVQITIAFLVRQTNVRSNLVYPFYLIEATLPPPPT